MRIKIAKLIALPRLLCTNQPTIRIFPCKCQHLDEPSVAVTRLKHQLFRPYFIYATFSSIIDNITSGALSIFIHRELTEIYTDVYHKFMAGRSCWRTSREGRSEWRAKYRSPRKDCTLSKDSHVGLHGKWAARMVAARIVSRNENKLPGQVASERRSRRAKV